MNIKQGDLENLKEYFKAIEAGLEIDETRMISALVEYANFIGQNADLSSLVKELACKGEIGKSTLQILFNFSTLRQGFRNYNHEKEDSGLPLFWDEEFEKSFGLFHDFLSMLALEDKRLKESKKQSVDVVEIVLPEDKNEQGTTAQEEYFKVRMLHNLILAKAFERKSDQELNFDPDSSLLHFTEKEIEISKTKDSNSHYLLETLFKDKAKTWSYDEIAQDWGDEYEKNDWQRYYNAGYKVNEKVAKKTTVEDFLEITRKTVAINKKYLN